MTTTTTRRPRLRADVRVRVTGGEYAGLTGDIVSAFTDGAGHWLVWLSEPSGEAAGLAWIKRADLEPVTPEESEP